MSYRGGAQLTAGKVERFLVFTLVLVLSAISTVAAFVTKPSTADAAEKPTPPPVNTTKPAPVAQQTAPFTYTSRNTLNPVVAQTSNLPLYGEPSYGGGTPGGAPSQGCPGCGYPVGGGSGGWFWSWSTGAGSYYNNGRGNWFRNDARGYPYAPHPIGTFPNAKLANPSNPGYKWWRLEDAEKDTYFAQGRPCGGPNVYYLQDNKVVNGVNQPSFLSRVSDVPTFWKWADLGVSVNKLGLSWLEGRYWGGGNLNNFGWGVRGCVEPPEPRLLWKDCPVNIENVSYVGPYGDKLVNKEDPERPRRVDLRRLRTENLKEVDRPTGDQVTEPWTWWYTSAQYPGTGIEINSSAPTTKPVDINGIKNLTGAAAMRAIIENYPAEKRFSAFYQMLELGRINDLTPWTYGWKTVWEQVINPCEGKWMTTNNISDLNENLIDNVGVYDSGANLNRIRCHMIVNPPVQTSTTHPGVTTGSLPNVITNWPEAYTPPQGARAPQPRRYGCGDMYNSTPNVERTVLFAKCKTKENTDETREDYLKGNVESLRIMGSRYGLTYTDNPSNDGPNDWVSPVSAEDAPQFDFNAYWWGTEVDCPDEPPPPPCEPDDPECNWNEEEKTVGYCEYETNGLPTIRSGEALSVQKGTIFADGSPTFVNWNVNGVKFFVRETGTDRDGNPTPPVVRELTGAELGTKVRDVKTTLVNNANSSTDRPFPARLGTNLPVQSSTPWNSSLPALPSETVFNFYRGTNFDKQTGTTKPFKASLSTSYKSLETETTLKFSLVNGSITVVRVPEETWVDRECAPVEVEIVATETRIGN